VLHIVFPVAFVLGSRFGVQKHSVAVGLVVLPLALVGVAVSMCEFALALGLIVYPVTLVESSIGPFLFAEPLAD